MGASATAVSRKADVVNHGAVPVTSKSLQSLGHVQAATNPLISLTVKP